MARATWGSTPGCVVIFRNRINQIVAIYESSLSDDEKMASLTEAVAQSLAEMQQAGSKDPEGRDGRQPVCPSHTRTPGSCTNICLGRR